MNSKPRPEAILHQLQPDEQEQVLFWLDSVGYRETLKLLANPRPEGFGIKTHLCSLYRFAAKHRHQEHESLAELAADYSQLNTTTPQFDNATATALREAAFELASSSHLDSDKFKSVARWVLKLRDQEHHEATLALEREKLALEREKFQYNAAREALLHLDALRDIMSDNTRDDEDRILAAREKLFGPMPEQLKQALTQNP